MFSTYARRKASRLVNMASNEITMLTPVWEPRKTEWLSVGRTVLRALASELAFDEFKVSSNPAGHGVWGESSMMGMWYAANIGIYVDLAVPWNVDRSFMWRTILHMKDYTGGHNRWLPYTTFNDIDELARALAKIKTASRRERQ